MRATIRRLFGVGAVGLLALVPAASASTFLAMSLDELVAESDQVVQGEVVQTRSFWDAEQRVILTDATLRVDRHLLGEGPPTVTVRTFGGRVDDYEVLAHGFPAFAEGDEVVLFLQEQGDGTSRVTGYQLGHYEVVDRDGSAWVVPTWDAGSRLLTADGRLAPGPVAQDLASFARDLRTTTSPR
jgi:hypothetical protein